MIDYYDWRGGREAMLRFGPADGPVVVVALPLFEEANRTRGLAAGICRMLGKRGVASVLPDFPGTGESLVATEQARLATIRAGHEAVATQLRIRHDRVFGAGIRSGALADCLSTLDGRWHFAPQHGADLVHELSRIRQLAGDKMLRDLQGDIASAPVEIAGNLISPALLVELQSAVSVAAGDAAAPLRVARLGTDPRAADVKFPGVPPWRRAEPDNDPVLAAVLADDIARWVTSCGA